MTLSSAVRVLFFVSLGARIFTPPNGLLSPMVQIGAALAFLVWFNRCSRKLQSRNIDGLRWAPMWSVAGWLIPVANLVIPYRVSREIWQASERGVTGTSWQGVPVPAFVLLWWLAFTFAFFGTQAWIDLRVAVPDSHPGAVLAIAQVLTLAWIVAAVLGAKFIRAVDARLE